MQEPQNPYAPPVETPDEPAAPGPQTPSLTLSAQGWATVTSLAKWMRIVSTFLVVFGVLLGLFSLVFMVLGGGAAMKGHGAAVGGIFAGGAAVMLIVTMLMIFASVWLRQAAHHFYDGVLSNAELALARGFRKLRLFMILYGVWSLIQLATTLFNVLRRGA